MKHRLPLVFGGFFVIAVAWIGSPQQSWKAAAQQGGTATEVKTETIKIDLEKTPKLPQLIGQNAIITIKDSNLELHVLSPPLNPTFSTTGAGVELIGTATGPNQVIQINWSSNFGEFGIAKGSSSWRSGRIPLAIGNNLITVTATDASNSSVAKTLTIKRLATSGEQFFSDDVRSSFYRGKQVTYTVVDGLAIFEGDIVLGTVDQLEASREKGLIAPDAGGISSNSYLWTNGVVPYTLGSNPTSDVQAAIDHWNSYSTSTGVTLVPRNNQNTFLTFARSSGCSSPVGMQGGVQTIKYESGCGFGGMVHEIGHSIGLWHEQSRNDRNNYVTINYSNIEPDKTHNFDQYGQLGVDIGSYDYGSIMHYGAYAFSANGQPTIVPTASGVTIGQRNGLSSRDLDGVKSLYAGLPELTITAGTQYVTPATVAAGSNITAGCSEDNTGSSNAGANVVSLYLSTDDKLTPGSNGDTYLDFIQFPSLPANSNSSVNSKSVQIPSGTAPGTYYLFFWVDGGQIVNEITESNNFATRQLTVTSGASCSYSISPTSQSLGSGGGSNNVSVMSGAGCAWTAVSNNSFITINSGNSGSGNGTVSYSVSSNSSTSQRTGTMTIAGRTFNVTQSGSSCNFSLSPTGESFGSVGQSNNVTVTAGSGCAWTAVSNNSFITINAGSSGSGNGTVSYSVSSNSSTSQRTGTMTIAGRTFNVTQSGSSCNYSLSPTSESFGSVGQSNNVTVTAGSGCAWTAVSNNSFITINAGSSGSGTGTVSYSVSSNSSPNQRTGTMTIAGRTFNLTQSGISCSYSLSPTSQSFGPVGESNNVSVTAGSGCAWTAVSNNSFITINAGSSGSGNGTVSYSVSANSSTSQRTGTMTIAGQTFIVTQSGASCNYSISPISQSFGSSGGSNSVSVTAGAGCAWTAASNNSFITVTSGSSGSGNGIVNYSVATNSDNQRSGTLTIAGQTFTVNQDAPNAVTAAYDTVLKAPKCGQLGSNCDSGTLLDGRDTMTGGPEANQPNTIFDSCADDTAGNYQVDESIDRIRVSTLDGSNLAAGKTVKIEVSVWAFSATEDFLDLYYAPDANNPNWTFIATLTPDATGAQVLSTTYTLPSGSNVQAVRANFRYLGAATPCSTSGFDDRDDLVFTLPSSTGAIAAYVLRGDFDGDGKADLAVWRPSSGEWFIKNSTGSQRIQTWGTAGDIPVPADYDGDGQTDLAVYRPSGGLWYVLNSANGSTRIQSWGLADDVPVPGDYDGDGQADVAVWRPSSGLWYILKSTNGSGSVNGWGTVGDVPVPGDYDGDLKSDIAVWRPSSGQWFIINSSNGSHRIQTWGAVGDLPVGGDYDGDGKTDLAVFRPLTGVWYIINSQNNSHRTQSWGTNGDIPVASDYDGDAKRDLAVWRPSSGTWYIINSMNNSQRIQGWGMLGDVPVTGGLIIR